MISSQHFHDMSSTSSTSQSEINLALPVFSIDTPIFDYQDLAHTLKRNTSTSFGVEIPEPLMEHPGLPFSCTNQRPVRYRTLAHKLISVYAPAIRVLIYILQSFIFYCMQLPFLILQDRLLRIMTNNCDFYKSFPLLCPSYNTFSH